MFENSHKRCLIAKRRINKQTKQKQSKENLAAKMELKRKNLFYVNESLFTV